MSSIVLSKTAVLLSSIFVLLAYFVGQPASHTLTALGFWRQPSRSLLADDQTDLIVIADTVNCEDLHYHAASQSLFTACEDTVETRFSWFPPLAIFDDPSVLETTRGSLHVIDPETATSRRLAMHGFTGPFCTHGIDILDDPDRPDGEAVYIYAINHLPNPDFPWNGTPAEKDAASAAVPKARSRIEVFHHVIGSSTATHLRSVQHPLIRTPNDIFAASPRSFYVTNDHYYCDGLLRAVETVVAAARWSDIVRVDMDESADAAVDPTQGITVSAALERLHNPNGLGHGRTPDEVLVSDCSSGVLNVFRLSPPPSKLPLELESSVRADSVIDNPSYFADPYSSAGSAGLPPDDRSGYVLPGISHGFNLTHTSHDPAASEGVIVMFAHHASLSLDNSEAIEAPRLLFQDDGSRIRSASAAVLLAIDPKLEGGRRRAWLFVTGFQSVSAIAVKVDL
ncbi:serum paraoxonase arylesterase family protein [Grosmannia clavigera kw1407]|uniref:Serum paraoxonase arylesterase family protein n=1 Tax=Grosmannia clavigera (strain kw1407 / UAMH 11150) TaxID=655863 RepID=F0XI76_GROCL|nr:serum paraoxonase arylesterase family protein [Grosmannia clavigera kw1407]EFX02960.1 serum paraoxonase arylesterase family protein [Grosmannia clavigera kw1407]